MPRRFHVGQIKTGPTVELIDRRIHLLRREFQDSKDESADMDILREINHLQRYRHLITGEFMPSSDGSVYYLDVDRGLWFEFHKPLEVMVG